MISLFSLTQIRASRYGPKPFQLKPSRNMVGRDVSPITQTEASHALRNHMIRAEDDDIRFTSSTVFLAAKNAVQSGGRAVHFQSVDLSDPEDINACQKASPLFSNEKYHVVFFNNTLKVYGRDTGKWELLDKRMATEDLRVTWDSNGSPRILQGGEALSVEGNLKAESANEILVRVSDRDVEAGAGTLVINLSTQKGTFSGGDGVTYLGSYGNDTVITGGKGRTNFAGYFNGAEIIGTEGSGVYSGVFEHLSLTGSFAGDTFNGYFSQVQITGGDAKNTFSGMFLNGSKLLGGEGDDTFVGRFVDSAIDGGKGNDRFGQNVETKGSTVLSADGQVYTGVSADFVDTDVISAEGDNSVLGTFWGGTVTLGSGNDRVRGAFIHSRVESGDGNDAIAAIYSESSSFYTGSGDNHVLLATARHNTVTTGKGSNSVTMGVNPGTDMSHLGAALGVDSGLAKTTFSSKEEFRSNGDGSVTIGMRFGELEGNSLDASEGTNSVHVNHGSGTQSMFIGNLDSLVGANQAESVSERQKDDKSGNEEEDSTADYLPASYTAGLAVQRYALVMGQGPKVEGGSALKVQTGSGDDVEFQYTYRNRIDRENYGDLRTVVRRFNGYSYTSI